MMYADSHVHTAFSSDGKDPVSAVTAEAERKGLCYLATTDHLDYDLKFGHNRSPIPWKHIDLAAYRRAWEEGAEALAKKGSPLKFRFGIEAGFSPEKQVQDRYLELFDRMRFDVVINSVHFVNGWDVYFPNAFFFKSRRRMYGDYLDLVLQSLDAPYHYDIVAHIGYVTRNAPYKKKVLEYADFPDKFDAILHGIIERGKALEVNTHTTLFPTEEILRKYYAYGGRKLSFGSDSHHAELCKDYQKTVALLKEIGFTEFTVFERGVNGEFSETAIPF